MVDIKKLFFALSFLVFFSIAIPVASAEVPSEKYVVSESTIYLFNRQAYSKTFENPLFIRSVEFKESTVRPVEYFHFYDVSNTLIKTVAVPTNNGLGKIYTYPVNVPGVKKISVAAESYDYFNIGYLYLYGYDPANLPNYDADKFVIKNLKATQNDKSLRFSWDAIDSEFFKNYKLYLNDVFIGDAKNNFYVVNGVKEGESYTLKVFPVDTKDKEFAGADITYKVPLPDKTPPEVPVLSGSGKDGKALLTWGKSPDEDIGGFIVYLNGTRLVTLGNVQNYQFEMKEFEKKYVFSVSAYDLNGNESKKSNEVTLKKDRPVTETDQEAGPEYLMVTWKKTEGATGYRIYLNGRLIGSVGPTVFEYKITRAMGYIPGAISNKAEARAVLADGTEGGGHNPVAPVIELGAGYGVGDAFKAGMEFVKLLNGWVLIALAIVLANMIIAFLYLLNKKYKITQRG